MSRPSWHALAVAGVSALAARGLWLAWQYYVNAGPRYRVESAMMALVIAGAIVVACRRGTSHTEPARERAGLVWIPIFLAGAVVLYAPAITLGLLSDDFGLRGMAQSDDLGVGSGWFFRPLPLLVWRVLLAFSDSAVPLHLVNILLHGLNAFLLSCLGAAFGMRRETALGAAAMFLTFPALPEAVVWAAGVQDVLMTTMALGVVVLSGRESPGHARLAAIAGVFVLGLGSKETAICIPGLVAICWMTPARLRRDVRLYIVLGVITVLYLAVRLPMGIGGDYLAAPSQYFFKQLIVIAFGTLSVPWRAPATTGETALALAAVVSLTLLFVHACLSWRRGDRQAHRSARLALWVLASIAPVFTLFFVGPMLEGSRYLYLASCAWALLVADLVASAAERASSLVASGRTRSRGRFVVYTGAIAVAVIVAGVSVRREIAIWQRAGDLRDRALVDARAAIAREGCSQATFTKVPDSVAGAYVFRNGWSEALAQGEALGQAEAPGQAPPEPGSAEPRCAFAWDGEHFVRQP
jgi:hypothetical protein